MSRLVDFNSLKDLTAAILRSGYGYSPEEADITSTLLAEADARGIPSHGVSRLAFYRVNLDAGHCLPGSEPEVLRRTPVSLLIDGKAGVGGLIAKRSVEALLDLAEAAGMGICAVRNSNHFGIAGYWAELMAKKSMVGAAFCNTYIAGVPTFGARRVLGTNPVCVAIPEAGGRIFMLDMATTTISHGKVELYDRRGQAMPPGWVVDETGADATDATSFERTFYQPSLGGHLYVGGSGEEHGGHKGYGLALLVELLSSGLSQGASSPETYPKDGGGGGITHLFACAALDLFGPSEGIRERVGAILSAIRGGEKAAGHGRIYTHGEKEAEARARSVSEGVFLDAATKAYLADLAAKFDLALPDGIGG